ncbi:MAG: aminotransferase class V-fold PLP-dependent enzyme, partial [Clostridia bacterium]
TGAIRFALGALLKPNDWIMLHDAPIYPTTKSSIEMMGLSQEFVDFNDDVALDKALENTKCKVALVQLTRQKIEDSYSFEKVIGKMKTAGLLVITDDNYAVMKVEKIGCEVGSDLSCFSSFKLLGAQGIGVVVGKKKYVQSIIDIHYSGGMQVQGFESLEVLRGLTYAPVALAIQSEVNERVIKRLNGGEIKGVKNAFLANAQSKVLIVELEKPNAERVLVEAEKLGGLPNPIGAESKFEIAPLFYRVSGTFLKADPTMKTKMIRINPNRAGDETILRILKT